MSVLPPSSPPSLAGFLDFVRNVMGIGTNFLPDASPAIPVAFAVALEIAYDQMATVSTLIYSLAVYNLAGDNLVNYAQDVGTPPPVYKDGLPYFAWLRKSFLINNFVAGVVSGSSDQATSENLEVIAAAKNFTLMDLQNLKTPWGRRYLEFAQQSGTLWGIS